ncbi:unnamed protein product, partial [marine sediment metagenome]
MPYKEEEPFLISYLGAPAVTNVIKTRLLGGPYISFHDFFLVLSYLYTTGAILGRARRSKLSILVKMLVVPGAEVNKFVKFLQENAKKRLEEFRNELGNEPDTFFEFIYFREVESALEGAGLSLTDIVKINTRRKNKLIKAFDEKVALKKASPIITLYEEEGIGFGSAFPELTERMYRNAFENIDMDRWSEARAHGLTLSEKPTIISLEEQEDIVLSMVAAYVSEYS